MLAAGIFDNGYLRIEHENYYLTCGNKPVELTRIGFLIISKLAECSNHYVTPQVLWQHLWNENKPFNRESLKVHICRLRIQLASFDIEIETKPNVGYRLNQRAKGPF